MFFKKNTFLLFDDGLIIILKLKKLRNDKNWIILFLRAIRNNIIYIN